MDPRLQHPFTCVIAGPTQCGKTVFLYNLLTNLTDLIKDPPKSFYGFMGNTNRAFNVRRNGHEETK
ncbi:hypothetical protein HOLleu_03260 [Holothuria leucospilota]|uniref:Uncharacterized protein n=1 Tax=Holothuria leucospilota TaxID=206669 RepID=A0A9Q1CTF3_HOLLE|nr:hypothetical protein HOLleu_03260 [Holothuria leucospilota]